MHSTMPKKFSTKGFPWYRKSNTSSLVKETNATHIVASPEKFSKTQLKSSQFHIPKEKFEHFDSTKINENDDR